MHGQEPDRQRQLGVFEDGAAGHAALVLAPTALPVPSPLAPKCRARRSSTLRADETLRPAGKGQRRLTLLLGAEAPHEFGHRQPRLKLHTVHRHGTPPVAVPHGRCGQAHRMSLLRLVANQERVWRQWQALRSWHSPQPALSLSSAATPAPAAFGRGRSRPASARCPISCCSRAS